MDPLSPAAGRPIVVQIMRIQQNHIFNCSKQTHWYPPSEKRSQLNNENNRRLRRRRICEVGQRNSTRRSDDLSAMLKASDGLVVEKPMGRASAVHIYVGLRTVEHSEYVKHKLTGRFFTDISYNDMLQVLTKGRSYLSLEEVGWGGIMGGGDEGVEIADNLPVPCRRP